MRISVPDDEYSLAMCSWVDLHVFVLCNDPSPLTEQAQRSASRYELMNIADWSATCSTPEGTGNVIAGEKSFRGHERSSMSTGACDCTHLFLPCARALEYQFMRSWNSISPQSPQLNLKSRKRKKTLTDPRFRGARQGAAAGKVLRASPRRQALECAFPGQRRSRPHSALRCGPLFLLQWLTASRSSLWPFSLTSMVSFTRVGFVWILRCFFSMCLVFLIFILILSPSQLSNNFFLW